LCLGEIESYDSKNNLFSRNEVFWLFYLYNLIFKDNSTFFRTNENDQHNLIEFDTSINQEMKQLNICLKEKINAIQVNSCFVDRMSSQNLIEVVSIFNKVLEKKKFPQISYNFSMNFDNMEININNCHSNNRNVIASLNTCAGFPVITGSSDNVSIINPSNENKNQNNLNPNFEYFIKKNNLIDNYLNENFINYFDKEKSFIENNQNLINKPNDKKENKEKTLINSTININGNFNNININSENIFNNNNNKLKNNNVFEFVNYKNINQTYNTDNTNYFNDIPFNINFQKYNNGNNYDAIKSNVINNIPIINSSISDKSSPIQDKNHRYNKSSEKFNTNKFNIPSNNDNLNNLNYHSVSNNQSRNSINNNNFSKNFISENNQTNSYLNNSYKIKDFQAKKNEYTNKNFSPINSIIFNNNNKTTKNCNNQLDSNFINRTNLIEHLNLDMLFNTQNNPNVIDSGGIKNNFSYQNSNHKSEKQIDMLEIPNNNDINNQFNYLNSNFSKQNLDIATSFASLFNNFPINCNNINKTQNPYINQQHHLENNLIDRINENKFEKFSNLNNLNNFVNHQNNYNYLDNMFNESSKSHNFDLVNLFGKINNYSFINKFSNENKTDTLTYNSNDLFNLDSINNFLTNNNSSCNSNKNLNLDNNFSNKYLLTFKDLTEIFNPNVNGNFNKCDYNNSLSDCNQTNNFNLNTSNITKAFQDFNNLINSNFNLNNNKTTTEHIKQDYIDNPYNNNTKKGLYNNNPYESSFVSNDEYKMNKQNLTHSKNSNNIFYQNYLYNNKNSLYKDQLKDESFDKPKNKIENSFKNFNVYNNCLGNSNKNAKEITEELNYLQNLQDNDKDNNKLNNAINLQVNKINNRNFSSFASSNKKAYHTLEGKNINNIDSKSENLLCFNDIILNSNDNNKNQDSITESYALQAQNILEKNKEKTNKKTFTDSLKYPKAEKNLHRNNVNNINHIPTNNLTLLESYEYINDTPGESVILSRTYSYEKFPINSYMNKSNYEDNKNEIILKKNFKKNKSNLNTGTYYFNNEEDKNPSFAGEFNPKIKHLEMLKKLKLEDAKLKTTDLNKGKDNFCKNEETCKNSESESKKSNKLNNKDIEILDDINIRIISPSKDLNENVNNSSLEELLKQYSINNKNNKEVEQILKSINNFKENEKYEMISKILTTKQKKEENQYSDKKEICNFTHKRILRKRSLSINKNKKIKASNNEFKESELNLNKSEENKIDNFKLNQIKETNKNAKIKNFSKANSNSKISKVDSCKEVSLLSSSANLNEIDGEHFISYDKHFNFTKNECSIKNRNNYELHSKFKENNNLVCEKEDFTHLSDLSLVENLSETKQDFVHNLKSLLLEANLNSIILDKNVWSLYKLRIQDKQLKNNENNEIKLDPVLCKNNSNFFTIEKSKKNQISQKNLLKNKRKLEKNTNTNKNSRSFINDVISPLSKFKNQNNKAKTADKGIINLNYSSEEDYFYFNSKEKECNYNNKINNNISESSNNSQSGKKRIKKNFIENIGKKTVNSNYTFDDPFFQNSANITKNFTNLKEDLKVNNNNSSNSGQNYVPNKYTKNALNVHSFSKSDLEIIDKVNFPRRKKTKSEVASKVGKSENKNLITTKTDISNYAEVYPKELEDILENERHVFMRNNFKNMYMIKNFYLYIKLNKLRRLNIKDLVVDFEKVDTQKYQNEKIVSNFDSSTDKRNKNNSEKPLSETESNEEIYVKNPIEERILQNSNVQLIDENIILIGKRITYKKDQNHYQKDIYSKLDSNCSEKKSVQNEKIKEEYYSLKFNNNKDQHKLAINFEDQAINSEENIAESLKIKHQILFEKKENNDKKSDLIESINNVQNENSKVNTSNFTKKNINDQEFKDSKEVLIPNSIKKIEQEIYKSIDEDNSDFSLFNKNLKCRNDPINKNEKMEIEENSFYSSKINKISSDKKVEEYCLNNLENSNMKVSMDIVENISISNSNSIPFDLEERDIPINKDINIPKEIDFLNKGIIKKKSNSINEEIHKLNIFDVGIVDNLGDFFVASTEQKVYNVNNYLSIKTEGNMNEPNYILEINKNIFCDEFNNTIEENIQKKIEDNVVDMIKPNLETKKLWDPNIIDQEKCIYKLSIKLLFILNLFFCF